MTAGWILSGVGVIGAGLVLAQAAPAGWLLINESPSVPRGLARDDLIIRPNRAASNPPIPSHP